MVVRFLGAKFSGDDPLKDLHVRRLRRERQDPPAEKVDHEIDRDAIKAEEQVIDPEDLQ